MVNVVPSMASLALKLVLLTLKFSVSLNVIVRSSFKLLPLTSMVYSSRVSTTVEPMSKVEPLAGDVMAAGISSPVAVHASPCLSPQMYSANSGWSMKGLRLPWMP